MSMQKTLGGDRLGSGKKMKVDLHGFERSTHDKGYIMRTTMSAGTLVPFLHEIALPGDTFDIGLDCDVKTHPTIGPLFGSYKVQLDVFLAPIRLYIGLLHNNALNIGRNMANVKIPQIELTAQGHDWEEGENPTNSQINPSSLLAYLGMRGVGRVDVADASKTRQFSALGILMYWEVYKNFYANKQEELGAVIHCPSTEIIDSVTSITQQPGGATIAQAPGAGTYNFTTGDEIHVNHTSGVPALPEQLLFAINIPGGPYGGYWPLSAFAINYIATSPTSFKMTFDFATWGNRVITNWKYITEAELQAGPPEVATFPLENIDTMRNAILAHDATVMLLNEQAELTPYMWLWEQPNDIPNVLCSQEGLACKTYQSDLFNNWLNTEAIDGPGGINEVTAISTAGDSFTLNALLMGRKLYDMLNRILVSGGSYNDWQDAVWAHDRYKQCESPMYMGGLIKELVFQEVVNNSASDTEEGTQPLGTLAGKGIMGRKHKGGNITVKVDEPSVLMGIVSLTPRIDYSQGNSWDVHLKTMDDLHKPNLDQIGFQDLITEQMAWWDTKWVTTEWVQNSAGKQPAWVNYMTNINKTYGNFAIEDNEMFMTLNRRYEFNDGIADLTTYIDPSKYNFIFAETALDSQNFWTQIAVDMTVRRKMSAKIMPNL